MWMKILHSHRIPSLTGKEVSGRLHIQGIVDIQIPGAIRP